MKLDIQFQDQISSKDFLSEPKTSILYTGGLLGASASLGGAVFRAKSFQENYFLGFLKQGFYNLTPILTFPSSIYFGCLCIIFDEDYEFMHMEMITKKKYPYFGAKFWQDWERPVHISMYVNNELVIDQNAGIKIFGAYSRGGIKNL